MADKQPKNNKKINFKLVGGQTIPGKDNELNMPPHASKEIASKYIFSLVNGGFGLDLSTLESNTPELLAKLEKSNEKQNEPKRTPKTSKKQSTKGMDIVE